MSNDLDFTYYDDGSVISLTPHSNAANAWCGDNLPPDAPMLGYAYVIERRYFEAIARGIDESGLRLSHTD